MLLIALLVVILLLGLAFHKKYSSVRNALTSLRGTPNGKNNSSYSYTEQHPAIEIQSMIEMAQTQSTLRVGIIGFSAQHFQVDNAQFLLQRFYDYIAKHYEGNVEIVSGLTNMGIPKIAYEEAATRGWQTIGFACSKAHNLPCFACDRVFIHGDNWGDESEKFLQYIHILLKVGGGAQSQREFTQFEGPKIEYKL